MVRVSFLYLALHSLPRDVSAVPDRLQVVLLMVQGAAQTDELSQFIV